MRLVKLWNCWIWSLGLVWLGSPLPALASYQWARVIGGSGEEDQYSVQPTNDGGYVLIGSTWQSFGTDVDAWLVKLESAGNISWQKTFAGPGAGVSDTAIIVRQTADGGY